jgi:Fe2+ or Zn2+ uptake regulation protein
VYRNLQRFKEQGLIDEFHFDENHHHYEVKPSTEHHHIVCLGCDKVIEFEYPLSQQIIKNVPVAKRFKVKKSEVHISGYCSDCHRKGLPETEK